MSLLSQTCLRRLTSASMPFRCSQSNTEASCRRSFRSEPGGNRLARRSVSAACFSRGENLCSNSTALIILAPSYAFANLQEHRQQSEVRSPTHRLAPNSPVRWTDQDRLVRPNIEPDVGLAPTRKAPRRNAGLASLAKLQVTILRREQDWQPMARNGKLPHISGAPSRGLGYSCCAGNQRRKAPFEIADLL
jgi:hypothetical protein